jgi:NMD protein affecting ribosome stability and mRNA decay
MVAVDIFEGGLKGREVAYCRRCGAVDIGHGWRRPDPHLWRGY